MSKRFIIVFTILVLGLFGFLIFRSGDDDSSGAGGQTSNNTFGNGSSGVVLVEYGDFECPACYQYFPIIAQIKEKYKDQITVQFKHLPLVEIHQNALIAARAAEAAALQGKFWDMHDALYIGQQEWAQSTNPQPTFEKYAQAISLDMDKFLADIKSEAVNATVQADRNEAKSNGHNSTPTFILDGKKLEETPRDIDGFSKLIDEAIAAKTQQ